MTAVLNPERTAAKRPLLIALWAGLALSVVAAGAPYLDIATADSLSDHVRDAYPDWPAADLRKDRDAIALSLAILGGLGALTWLGCIAAVAAGKRWARGLVTGAFAVGTTLALTAAALGGEGYGTILPPAFGALVMLPSLAGLAAVVLVWRRGN